jgi:hypothetical protein
MWKFTLEFLSYIIFVFVLYAISYSNRSSDEYRQVNHLRQLFLNPHNFTYNYSQVRISSMFCSFCFNTV